MAATIALASFASPGLARAEGEAAVAVVPGSDGDSRLVVEAVWSIRQAVEADKALKAVSVEERLVDAGPDSIEEGRAALAEGRQAFGDLDLERAARAFEMAARLLAPQAAQKEDAIEALDLLAQARAAARDELGAALAYARVIRLDPAFEPDTESLGPSVEKAWKRARALERAGRPGPLRIESAMAPAAVYVDGQLVGVTPQLIEAPPSLSVSVTLRADGYASWSRTLALRPKQGAAVEATLDPLSKSALLFDIQEKLSPQWERETMGTALKDLRSLLFADQVILVGLEGEDVKAQLHDVKVGRRVRTVRWPVRGDQFTRDDGEEVVEALYRDVDAHAPGSTELASEEPESLDGRSGGGLRFMDAWWFWPAVGVAALTAVVVPIVVLSGDDETALDEHEDQGAVVLRF